MSSLTLFKLDSLSSPFSFCLVAQKTEVNEENMRRNLYDFFFCFIVVGFFAMKESKCLGAALNLELCSLFPSFFLPATTRTNDKYVHFCVFFTWSFLITIFVW